MLFEWLKKMERQRLLAEPFPEEWLAILHQNVYHYAHLSLEERAKLRDDLRILVAEKNWEGCRGFAMNDEVKVTIAAEASLLLLGLKDQYFDMVQSILIYPDAYVAPGQRITKGSVILEGDSSREGEAWYRGPVILSWADALAGARHETDGDNLALHEFAHQLDMQNGRVIDGTPPLESADQYHRWQEIMNAEYKRLIRDCRRGRPTLLDCYGATSIGEFFAVATECFFEKSGRLSERHPRLYEILSSYYRQDPAARATTAREQE
jgi:Mlc titration factor MtfA (ptsG expression regulator)